MVKLYQSLNTIFYLYLVIKQKKIYPKCNFFLNVLRRVMLVDLYFFSIILSIKYKNYFLEIDSVKQLY